MALRNGVLVHGPTSWGCAVRLPGRDAEGRSGAEARDRQPDQNPLLRGPARLLEAFAVLPSAEAEAARGEAAVRAAGDARLDGAQRPSPSASCARSRLGAAGKGARPPDCSRSHRRSSRCAAPSSPSTTAPSTSRSGRTSTASQRAKEHERCGSHLVGPLLVTTAAANVARVAGAGALPRPARFAASLGALAASTELFGWMVRNPDRPLARALAKPGHELQHRFATRSRRPQQVEVAEAALQRMPRIGVKLSRARADVRL